MAYEDQVRDPEGTTVNPAVTDEFKARVATVQKLLFQGDAYFRTGQFDKVRGNLLQDSDSRSIQQGGSRQDGPHRTLQETRGSAFAMRSTKAAAMEKREPSTGLRAFRPTSSVPPTRRTPLKLDLRSRRDSPASSNRLSSIKLTSKNSTSPPSFNSSSKRARSSIRIIRASISSCA